MQNTNSKMQKGKNKGQSAKGVLFAFCILFFVFSNQAFSQGCVIDTNIFELIYPPSDDLPCIVRNEPYSASIQFFSQPSLAGFTIDSILITTFLNLPAGITYTLTPSPCKLYPYDRGCVHISGTTTDSVGSYTVDYNGFVYLPQGTPSFDYLRANFGGALPEYSLKVIEQGEQCPNTPISGIKNVNGNAGADFSVYPNPTNGVFELKINSDKYRNAEVKVSDATGRVIYSTNADNTLSGKTTIDLSAFPKGLYLVQLRNAEGAVSKNISVE